MSSRSRTRPARGGARPRAGRPRSGNVKVTVTIGQAQIRRAELLAHVFGGGVSEIYRRALAGQLSLGPARKRGDERPYWSVSFYAQPELLRRARDEADARARARGADDADTILSEVVRDVFAGAHKLS